MVTSLMPALLLYKNKYYIGIVVILQDVGDLTTSKKKRSTADRRRAAKEEEARLREVEKTLLDSESNPQSANQFDRAVLSRPDDADLWIKYMSHHLQVSFLSCF